MKKVIGITGRKRHGKDTASAFIMQFCSDKGIPSKKIAFADKVRELILRSAPESMSITFNDLSGEGDIDRDNDDVFEYYGIETNNRSMIVEEWKFRFMVELNQEGFWLKTEFNCMSVPVMPFDDKVTVRMLLQFFGSDIARDCYSKSIWIDMALREGRNFNGVVIYSDVRFNDEAQAIIDEGGSNYIVYMKNAHTEQDTHESEAGVSPHLIHADIENVYGEMMQFQDKVKQTILGDI